MLTSIQNDGQATGGLVGTHRSGPIQDSFSTASVTGLTIVGGLVGSMYGVGTPLVLERSYFAGMVTLAANAEPTYKGLGGLVGVAITDTKISQCFAAGAVVSMTVTKGGGLVGEPGDELVDDYWDITRSGAANCAPSLAVAGCSGANASNATPTYFFTASSLPLSAWDFTTVWAAQSDDFPRLR